MASVNYFHSNWKILLIFVSEVSIGNHLTVSTNLQAYSNIFSIYINSIYVLQFYDILFHRLKQLTC
jgi:hypothetical protein